MKCTIDNCNQEATHTFHWPWGDEGACCSFHVLIVQQKAGQTRKGAQARITFVPLNPDREIPITRDERVSLHSARLTAESERDDARAHVAKLFAANTQLTQDLRALRVRTDEFERQVKALTQQVEAAYAARDKALALAGEARERAAELGVDFSDAEPLPLPPPPEAPPPTPSTLHPSLVLGPQNIDR